MTGEGVLNFNSFAFNLDDNTEGRASFVDFDSYNEVHIKGGAEGKKDMVTLYQNTRNFFWQSICYGMAFGQNEEQNGVDEEQAYSVGKDGVKAVFDTGTSYVMIPEMFWSQWITTLKAIAKLEDAKAKMVKGFLILPCETELPQLYFMFKDDG